MRTGLVTALVTLAVSLAGCSSGDEPSSGTAPSSSQPSSQASASPSPSGDTGEAAPSVHVVVEGDSVTPHGDRVEVDTGESLTLHITSDRAGELHVHATPEQELTFGKGDSTVTLNVDKPGIVDVEEHESGVVVLQLEVS